MILRNEEERVSKGQHSEAQMIGALKQLEARRTAADVATAYAPFGETYASVGTLDPSYTGQTDDTSSYRQDTAGGLYDFPLREYSTQGRWPNPDPLGRSATCPKDPQTQNRYAYVRNNPMTYTDPTGGMMNPNPDPYPGGGGGGCDPDDPLCGGGGFPCYPDDPLCDPCVFEPELCYPGGGGGFTPGGSGSPEQPRPFPWPQLPAGFFNLLGQNGTGTSKCILMYPSFRGLGCIYLCYGPGGIAIGGKSCGPLDEKALKLCPFSAEFAGGVLVSPPDFCGKTIP